MRTSSSCVVRPCACFSSWPSSVRAFFGGFSLVLLFSELSQGRLGNLKLGLPASSAPWLRRAVWAAFLGWAGLVLLSLVYAIAVRSQANLTSIMSFFIPGVSINFPRPRFYTGTALALGALSLLLAARRPTEWLDRILERTRRLAGLPISKAPGGGLAMDIATSPLARIVALIVVLVGLTLFKA